MRRWAALGLTLLVAALWASSGAWAASRAERLAELKHQLAAIEASIHRHEARLQQVKLRIGSEQYRLRQVTDALGATEAKLTYLDRAVAHTQVELANTRAELRRLTRSLHRDQHRVAEAVRVFDAVGSGGFLDVLLSAQSFSDFTSRLAFVRQIFASDFAVLAQMQADRSRLAAAQARAQRTAAYLAALHSATEGDLHLLSVQQQEVQSALSALAQQQQQEQQAVASDEGNQQQIEAAIQALGSHGPGVQALGDVHFIWPVQGPITSPFGYRLDPVTHQYALHTGIDIGAGYGTPIRAAAAGTVVLAGWVEGYGNTTVIDLGNGVSNLYAHQDRIIVHVGETVSQGQVIGYVGATGWATGPHLHFEIRVNGKAINPLPYLP
jgi:murein DD-endopeptidase MepM/ murein hydrolase activator NlpD